MLSGREEGASGPQSAAGLVERIVAAAAVAGLFALDTLPGLGEFVSGEGDDVERVHHGSPRRARPLQRLF